MTRNWNTTHLKKNVVRTQKFYSQILSNPMLMGEYWFDQSHASHKEQVRNKVRILARETKKTVECKSCCPTYSFWFDFIFLVCILVIMALLFQFFLLLGKHKHIVLMIKQITIKPNQNTTKNQKVHQKKRRSFGVEPINLLNEIGGQSIDI